MAATTTETSLATVRRFMHAILVQELDEARSLLHDDFVISKAVGLPFSGEYHGWQGLLELLTEIAEVLEFTTGPIVEHPLTDDIVAARYRPTFTARASGKSVEMGVLEVFTVRNGMILEVDVYYKDPSAVAALLTE
jgi:uncharacterized protein